MADNALGYESRGSVLILPCVCGEDLVALTDAEMEDEARRHLEYHRDRGDSPGDFDQARSDSAS